MCFSFEIAVTNWSFCTISVKFQSRTCLHEQFVPYLADTFRSFWSIWQCQFAKLMERDGRNLSISCWFRDLFSQFQLEALVFGAGNHLFPICFPWTSVSVEMKLSVRSRTICIIFGHFNSQTIEMDVLTAESRSIFGILRRFDKPYLLISVVIVLSNHLFGWLSFVLTLRQGQHWLFSQLGSGPIPVILTSPKVLIMSISLQLLRWIGRFCHILTHLWLPVIRTDCFDCWGHTIYIIYFALSMSIWAWAFVRSRTFYTLFCLFWRCCRPHRLFSVLGIRLIGAILIVLGVPELPILISTLVKWSSDKSKSRFFRSSCGQYGPVWSTR